MTRFDPRSKPLERSTIRSVAAADNDGTPTLRVVGLQWSDIDPEAACLTVPRAVVLGAGLTADHTQRLRHSHATALLRAGTNLKVVAERLGHSSISVTLDIYSAVLPTMQRNAVEQLARMFEAQ